LLPLLSNLLKNIISILGVCQNNIFLEKP